MAVDNEKVIRAMIRTYVEKYARNFHCQIMSELLTKQNDIINKRHETDYWLIDEDTGVDYLVELKIGRVSWNMVCKTDKEY